MKPIFVFATCLGISLVCNFSKAQDNRCYVSVPTFDNGKLTLAVGPSYEKSNRIANLGESSMSPAQFTSALERVRTLQEEGICAKEFNGGTCFIDRGIVFTGLSIRNGGSVREVLYYFSGQSIEDFKAAMEGLKAVGQCSDIEF
jgi:hypothetical protein